MECIYNSIIHCTGIVHLKIKNENGIQRENVGMPLPPPVHVKYSVFFFFLILILKNFIFSSFW